MRPAGPFCAVRDAFQNFQMITIYIKLFILSFKSARPASEQVPLNNKGGDG